jgi:integrase/recombinase XerD
MTATSLLDAKVIKRFLRAQHFRHPATPENYAGTLRNFAPTRGTVGPRIHDLRHTMVAHRMRDWYESGINPQSRLPYLATYLGHRDIRSTLVYLNITPELLQKASERFRKNGAAALRATEGAR